MHGGAAMLVYALLAALLARAAALDNGAADTPPLGPSPEPPPPSASATPQATARGRLVQLAALPLRDRVQRLDLDGLLQRAPHQGHRRRHGLVRPRQGRLRIRRVRHPPPPTPSTRLRVPVGSQAGRLLAGASPRRRPRRLRPPPLPQRHQGPRPLCPLKRPQVRVRPGVIFARLLWGAFARLIVRMVGVWGWGQRARLRDAGR